MKNILIVLVASLLSAFIAVSAYRQIAPTQQIIIRETSSASFASDKNSSLGDYPARTFLSSSPTDFISSAKEATPAVVYIESRISSNNFWGERILWP